MLFCVEYPPSHTLSYALLQDRQPDFEDVNISASFASPINISQRMPPKHQKSNYASKIYCVGKFVIKEISLPQLWFILAASNLLFFF